MKRYFLIITLWFLILACNQNATHTTTADNPFATLPAYSLGLDQLHLPDGTTVALGDQVDLSRLTAVGGGWYQVKAAFAVMVLADSERVVAIVNPANHGGTFGGFILGSTPDRLSPEFMVTTFGGQPSFASPIPGGVFYAVAAGCPPGHLNIAVLVANGYRAPVEAATPMSPCDTDTHD